MAQLQESREYLAALQRQLELARDFGIALYKPHRKQDLFHRAGRFKRRMYRAGNRGGKSTCGVVEDVSWSLGYRPFYAEGDLARYDGIPRRATKLLVIAADWDKVRDIFTNEVEGEHKGKIWKMLPKDSIAGVHKNQSGHIESIRVKSKWGGESLIIFDTVKSYLSNKLGQESSMFDAIHVDEPCPEEMWVANSRGLVDNHGCAWFTLTPITQPWIDDMFMPEGGMRSDRPDGYVKRVMSDKVELVYWSVTGTIYDNPYNSKEAIAQFMADLKEDEKEARIYGRPQLYAGVIYREFDDSVHIYHEIPRGWDDFNDPPRDYTIRVAIDTHPRRPHATLFAATAPSGHTFFWDELFENGQIHEYVQRIYDVLEGRVPLRTLLELQAFNQNPVGDGTTMAEEFWNSGLSVEKAPRDLTFGIMKVRDELSKRDPKGVPWLLFSPRLRETLREFGRYVWNPDSGKPMDRDDHMMENLYRLVISGLEYVAPSTGQRVQRHMLDLAHPSLQLPKMPDMSLAEFSIGKGKKRVVRGTPLRPRSMDDRWKPLDSDWNPELRTALNKLH